MIVRTTLALTGGMLLACGAQGQPARGGGGGEPPTPGFNHPIPEQIMTPSEVETRIGTLEFTDGVPTAETTRLVYDHLDFLRGVEVFLNFVPACSVEAIRLGMADLGITRSYQASIYDTLLDSSPLLLTGNTDTVYCISSMDLGADGPTVVEIPPGCGPGTVNDAFFRFVIDMGGPGPDAGRGGKYLIVPDWYDGPLPQDKAEGGEYYIARSPSRVNLLILRGFLVDGKPDAASQMFRNGLRVYPLSQAASPPAMQFNNASTIPVNTIHANDFTFYEELDHVIQREPLEVFDPELRGLAAAIGIVKGRGFAPDARMTEILTDAVAVGNATARAIAFRNRDPRARIFEDRQWMTGFIGGDYRWLDGDGAAGRNLDARTYFFYVATVNTPAMAARIPGRGSQYAFCGADRSGEPLDGSRTYRVNIPANVPAKDFWSVVVYDPQTRSELQTSQAFPSKNNRRDSLVANDDGSVDLYFGPPGSAPAGLEANWTETVAGKGWFCLLRLYGPLEPWFERTWRPGDFEVVE